MFKNRFNFYFPILYYFGEFLVIVSSTHIMLEYTHTKWTYLNNLFIAFWFLISIARKSHVVGRDIKKSKLIKSSLKKLFLFSGVVSILNLLFVRMEFYLLTIIIAASLFYFLMILYRLSIDSILKNYRATGGNILKCIVIVHKNHGIDLYKEIVQNPELGYRCDGVFFVKKHLNLDKSVPNLGYFSSLNHKEISNYDMIFFSQKLSLQFQEEIIKLADDLNIKINSIPILPFFDVKNFFISKISTVPYIKINKLPLDKSYNFFIKRSFDIIFSFLVIILILSWFVPLIGLLIKISSKGPVFFIQKREGFRGKIFNCIKFRSMVVNSYSDSVMADENDSRITKFGKFLRISSIDEVPQFFNVFFGDMSIVGPRPHPIKLNECYNHKIKDFNLRHRYKPGITGLSQVSGYSGYISSFDQMNKRVKTDLAYFKNWSLIMDIKIMFKTFLILFNQVLKLKFIS